MIIRYTLTNNYYKEYREQNPEYRNFISDNSIRYTSLGDK
jgi:hypothetical protein